MSSPKFSDRDIEILAESIGKPSTPAVRSKVMAKLDQLEREIAEGTRSFEIDKEAPPVVKEPTHSPRKSKGKERQID